MKTKIENFLLNLDTDIDIISSVDIDRVDFNNAFDSIVAMIDDNNGFDIEIIYYANAIAFLAENDPSLQRSLEIALSCGLEIQNLNSETLASLLSSNIAREEFYELEDGINEFFEELEEED